VDAVRGQSIFRTQGRSHLDASPLHASLLPGILLSLSYLIAVLAIGSTFIVGTAITLFFVLPFYFPVLWAMNSNFVMFLLPFVIVAVLKWFMQSCLFNRWLSDKDGDVKHPIGFSLVFTVFSIINLVYGLLFCIVRFCRVLAIQSISVIFRIDRLGFEAKDASDKEKALLSDPVHYSFCVFVYHAKKEYHPVFRYAIRALNKSIGTASNGEVNTEARLRRLRVRNRFWLAVTLSRNPSLAQFRSSRLLDLAKEKEDKGFFSFISHHSG